MSFRLCGLTLVVAIGAGWGCASAPTGPSAVPAGVWSGDHLTMTVAGAATQAEFDCAHGDIPTTLTMDGQGQFNGAGTFARERGGPVSGTPDSHPATYAGSVSAATMTVTVRLTDTGELIGTFTLTRGSPSRVVKCV